MEAIHRRTFLKQLGSAVIMGVITGNIVPYVGREVNRVVQETTGHQTGNAGVRREKEQSCQANPNPQNCVENYEFSIADKVTGIIVAPISEEISFRALPSLIVSITGDRKDPLGDVFTGTGGLGMTRRELVVGVVSSVIFGAPHNITDKGIDTKTIPASQTVGGMANWYLQRKFGIVSNILAHALNNYKALTS